MTVTWHITDAVETSLIPSYDSISSVAHMHVVMQGLNIDGGREIKIRLIQFGSKDQYLPYEAIIGTMLHELCHNEFGPHNAHFYKLLDQITLVQPMHLLSVMPNLAKQPVIAVAYP